VKNLDARLLLEGHRDDLREDLAEGSTLICLDDGGAVAVAARVGCCAPGDRDGETGRDRECENSLCVLHLASPVTG
jgi:hypothetical protein